ncbi:citrate synthase, partial [Cupriavidus sp. WS]|uniref:citrate synthase n=1 Tax=Cupriavidus sp. WS TaxID=1312922 RepID=UPI00036666DD
MSRYLSSAEAAARLGVSRQTLYAYVSRGLLHAHDGETPRESRYLAADVEQLAGQRTRGRKPREVAKATLSWGLPVLESGITLIEDGCLYYRGCDAAALSESVTLEALGALLWQCPEPAAFGAAAPAAPAHLAALRAAFAGHRSEEALLPLFTVASHDDDTAQWQKSPARLAAGCGALVRLLATCLLGTAPAATPVHRQCASAWGVDEAGADLIRMALVLCADHELNASSFTARCVASTGASLRASVVGGLAALTGGRHGGATARVEALWDELAGAPPEARLRERL